MGDNGIVYILGKNGIPTEKEGDGRYIFEFGKQLTAEQVWYTEDAKEGDT